MRLNEHAALSTSKVLLVPYCDHHIPTYHKWMQDPDLQSATASNPLTLDEEYAMQRSWRTDKDKLTFIICLPLQTQDVKLGECDSENRMIGDINLFLFENESERLSSSPTQDEGSAIMQSDGTTSLVGEIELMIARKDLQRQGYGRSALLTFTDYVLSNWEDVAREYSGQDGRSMTKIPSLAYLRVIINQTNSRSIKLFESVGFDKTAGGPNYFCEIELRWQCSADYMTKLKAIERPQKLPYVNYR